LQPQFGKMIVFKHIQDLQEYVREAKAAGHTAGFVPTMGALHNGHISLVAASKKENQLTICSIFVNPTQFNDPEDFKKYPITIEKDLALLNDAGCDVVFLPQVSEMYPKGLDEQSPFDFGEIEKVLEGHYRPGHFDGVGIIVYKLLLAAEPNNIYMGAKDFQQCMIVKSLIRQASLPVQLHIRPTLRETDGLAMSSRNTRLSAEDREKAPELFIALNYIKDNQTRERFNTLRNITQQQLGDAGFTVDYLALADADTLELLHEFDPTRHMQVLVAASIHGVRLIDNLSVNW